MMVKRLASRMTESIYNSPAIYRDMVILATPELEALLPESTAKEIAHKIAEKFCHTHKGKKYLIPVLRRANLIERDSKLLELSKTRSIKALAKEHGLTIRTVKLRILKERRRQQAIAQGRTTW